MKMDYSSLSLDFQLEKLNYKFKNSDLLMQALTDQNSKCKLFRKNDRLRVLGESVLKLVACQYAIMTCDTSSGADEVEWTKWKSYMLKDSKQKKIGEKLLTKQHSDLEEDEFLDSVHKLLFTGSTFYSKFVKALFGAVFIDAGVSAGVGILTCLHLFEFLWSGMGYLDSNVEKHSLQIMFPPPNPEVKQFWEDNGLYEKSYIDWLMRNIIGMKIENTDYLREALIHKSFYNTFKVSNVMNLRRQPNYEAMEFLGDAVLGGIICQHFCSTYLDSDVETYIEARDKYIKNSSLRKVYSNLQLDQFVKMDGNAFADWKGGCDIIESLIGAMYLDGGVYKAKEFILQIFNLEKVKKIRITTSLPHLKQLMQGARDEKEKQVNTEKDLEERFISNEGGCAAESRGVTFTSPKSQSYLQHRSIAVRNHQPSPISEALPITPSHSSPRRTHKTWQDYLAEDYSRTRISRRHNRNESNSCNLTDLLSYTFYVMILAFVVFSLMLILPLSESVGPFPS